MTPRRLGPARKAMPSARRSLAVNRLKMVEPTWVEGVAEPNRRALHGETRRPSPPLPLPQPARCPSLKAAQRAWRGKKREKRISAGSSIWADGCTEGRGREGQGKDPARPSEGVVTVIEGARMKCTNSPGRDQSREHCPLFDRIWLVDLHEIRPDPFLTSAISDKIRQGFTLAITILDEASAGAVEHVLDVVGRRRRR